MSELIKCIKDITFSTLGIFLIDKMHDNTEIDMLYRELFEAKNISDKEQMRNDVRRIRGDFKKAVKSYKNEMINV